MPKLMAINGHKWPNMAKGTKRQVVEVSEQPFRCLDFDEGWIVTMVLIDLAKALSEGKTHTQIFFLAEGRSGLFVDIKLW